MTMVSLWRLDRDLSIGLPIAGLYSKKPDIASLKWGANVILQYDLATVTRRVWNQRHGELRR